MWALRGWSVLAAAAVSLALGVGSVFQRERSPRREPRWAEIVAPLARAPIPAGSVVVLVRGAGSTPEDGLRLLSEAAWRRPDLRLALAEQVPPSLAPTGVVTVGDAAGPVGWRQAWGEGALRLWVGAPR